MKFWRNIYRYSFGCVLKALIGVNFPRFCFSIEKARLGSPKSLLFSHNHLIGVSQQKLADWHYSFAPPRQSPSARRLPATKTSQPDIIMTNPYDSHPIYSLRRCLLTLAIISFIFGTLACSLSMDNSAVWAFHVLWTFCSALWSVYDLVRYALQKAKDPEREPAWPSKVIILGDAVFILLFGFWCLLELVNLMGYRCFSDTAAAYASVTAVCYV